MTPAMRAILLGGRSLRVRGNRVSAIGDSTTRGVYTGDSQPGITDGVLLTAYLGGDSWITWASTLSGGAVNRTRNAGVTGDTAAMMDARIATDVIAASPKPDACIVYSGYNDAAASVSVAAFMASIDSMVVKLRNAGIVPILATPLPTANNPDIAELLIRYALAIRDYAGRRFILIDFHQWARDTGTGGLIAAVGDGGDGVHPGAAGQQWLGQRVADFLTPLLINTSASPLQVAAVDATNIAPNGLFSGEPTSGLAPNVFNYNPRAGTVDSVVTDSLVPGSMQRCTHTATAGGRTFAQRIAQSGNWAPGDVLEFSGIITCSGIDASVQVDFNTAPYAQMPLSLTQDATRGFYRARLPVPADIGVAYIDVMMNSGPGTGYADFGQLTVRNLTALGQV
jgi:lysophospholipase L1-like esterase